MKLDDQNHTVGEGHASKQPQNKICFGVFASISHQFNLRSEKWATEVSTALQSAFRVLSLTRPELPMIVTMLLKSEGFFSYKELGSQVYDSLAKVNEALSLSDRDDYFSITVRDVKRLLRCSQIIIDEKLGRSNMSLKKKNQMMTYNMELKSRAQIAKEQEDEDERERKIQQERK